VVVAAADLPRTGVDTGVLTSAQSPTSAPAVDLGAAAAADAASAVPGAVTTVSETVVAAVASASAPALPARADKPDEHARADTTAGIGFWIQLGAFKQRDGALDFQRRLIDEQPWLGAWRNASARRCNWCPRSSRSASQRPSANRLGASRQPTQSS